MPPRDTSHNSRQHEADTRDSRDEADTRDRDEADTSDRDEADTRDRDEADTCDRDEAILVTAEMKLILVI